MIAWRLIFAAFVRTGILASCAWGAAAQGAAHDDLLVQLVFCGEENKADFSRDEAAYEESDLRRFFRLLEGNSLAEHEAVGLLRRLAPPLQLSDECWQPQERMQLEKNIGFVLEKVYLKLFERILQREHYALAAQVLALTFAYRVVVFSPLHEAATGIRLPVAAPLLHLLAQALSARRQVIAHLQQRPHLRRSPLVQEYKAYRQLRRLKNLFLVYVGTHHLLPLIASSDHAGLWQSIAYLNNKTDEFKDILAAGGLRHLLHLRQPDDNLLFIAARLGNFAALRALTFLVKDFSRYRNGEGETLFHKVLSTPAGKEEEIFDFLQAVLFAKRSDAQEMVAALRTPGATTFTPLRSAAKHGYSRCVDLLKKFLRQERAYDPLEHGQGASIVPFAQDNSAHRLLQGRLFVPLQAFLAQRFKAYENSISTIYHPAFALVYSYFLRELPNFSCASAAVQLSYLAGALEMIVAKIKFDCEGSYLNAELLYSYLCAGEEGKLSLGLRQEIKQYLQRSMLK